MVVDPDRLDYVDRRGGRVVMSSKILDRPREVAVVLHLDSGVELLVARSVIDAPDDFAVLTGEGLREALFDCVEVMRIP